MKFELYMKNIIRYSLVLILAMFLKVLTNISTTNAIEYGVIYNIETVVGETYSFEKPHFNNNELNVHINNYLINNSCTNLEYNIFEIDAKKVSVYLNCGTPKNILFDYGTNSAFKFVDLLTEPEEFNTSVRNLMNKKYPTFVTDETDVLNGTYKISNNELYGYFSTTNFGNITIKINSNEIKDLLSYNMTYDETYENEVFKINPEDKLIAFSFDDGPSTYDLGIVDSLVNSHSTATFFMVGNRIDSFHDSVFKIVNAGMEVGNHTYDHKSLTKLSTEKVTEEITKTNEKYTALTGKTMNLMRPSYGAINKTVALTTGMPVILWNIDTLDWKTRDTDKTVESILSAKDGDIVLMHSLYKPTADAVAKSLPELYKKGFRVVSVGELMQYKGKTLIAGNTYRSAK